MARPATRGGHWRVSVWRREVNTAAVGVVSVISNSVGQRAHNAVMTMALLGIESYREVDSWLASGIVNTGLRVLALCVLLAGAEMLHGIARTVWVVPRIGKERALKWSAVTGSLLALALCAWRVPSLELHGVVPHLVLGLVLAAFMAAFDIAVGRWVMRRPWSKIWPDFNPATGNYLLYAALFLAAVPLLVGWVGGRL